MIEVLCDFNRYWVSLSVCKESEDGENYHVGEPIEPMFGRYVEPGVYINNGGTWFNDYILRNWTIV